jgi:hypothetical protein
VSLFAEWRLRLVDSEQNFCGSKVTEVVNIVWGDIVVVVASFSLAKEMSVFASQLPFRNVPSNLDTKTTNINKINKQIKLECWMFERKET